MGAAPALADRDQLDWSRLGVASLPAVTSPRAVAEPKQARSAPVRTASLAVDVPQRRSTAPSAPPKAARITTDDTPTRRSRPAPARQPVTGTSGGTLSGIASYYWQPQPLASGGRFNPNALTAAHKTLPFGTRVRVTHGGNGRSVEVVINDRGPYIAGRIIDLSRRAAEVIGMTGQGIARVSVNILGR